MERLRSIRIPNYFRFIYKERVYNIKREYLFLGVSLFVFCIILCFSAARSTPTVKSKQLKTINKDGTILVLFTTFSDPDEQYMDITAVQHNTLMYMSLMPNTVGILFTDSSYWLGECLKYDIHCYSDFPKNNNGLPFLFGMFQTAIEKAPNVPFYGYINGDILIERTLPPLLFKIKDQMDQGILRSKVALFTQRHNFYFKEEEDMYTTSNVDELFKKQKLKSRTYWDMAIDLFVFTPNAFPWEFLPKFVIGRAKFDNWLIQYVNRADGLDSIDATPYVSLLHQTGRRGNRSGVKKERAGEDADKGSDLVWNDLILSSIKVDCCDELWFSEQATHTVVPTSTGICIEQKGHATYFEDDFQYNEIQLMKLFIPPEANCLVIAEGSLSGQMNQFCKTVTALLYKSEECIDTSARIGHCFSPSIYQVFCNPVRPDLYAADFVAPLATMNKQKYDVVVVLVKEAPRLIKNLVPLLSNDVQIYLRRWKQQKKMMKMLKGVGYIVVKETNPQVKMEGPHFPDFGFACVKLI
ncbi:hypothetical protein WA158_001621 [Blastocystis sp. Blastoise]